MGDKTNSLCVYFVNFHDGDWIDVHAVDFIELTDPSVSVTIDRTAPQTITFTPSPSQFQLTIPLKEEDYIKLKEIIEREKENTK